PIVDDVLLVRQILDDGDVEIAAIEAIGLDGDAGVRLQGRMVEIGCEHPPALILDRFRHPASNGGVKRASKPADFVDRKAIEARGATQNDDASRKRSTDSGVQGEAPPIPL